MIQSYEVTNVPHVTLVTSVTPVTDVTKLEADCKKQQNTAGRSFETDTHARARGDGEPISESWNREIYELEEFFASCLLPAPPVRLDDVTVISDLALFLSAHMATLKANRGNQTFLPHLQRLLKLKKNISHETEAKKEMCDNRFANESTTEDQIIPQGVTQLTIFGNRNEEHYEEVQNYA